MLPVIRTLRRTLALTGGVALLASGMTAATISAASAASTATGGNGASLPYVEVLAQNSATNGTVIGPSYTQGQLADEAVGREAVTLQGTGKYVTFTTPVATNSIDFRYSIPDTSDGSVYTAPLSLYINGTATTPLTLTNEYSWQYGGYPFTNTPGSAPEHFFDEVHRLFSTTYPAGTTFKLQVDSGDNASSYTINLADFENVAAPLTQPSGSVSVTSEGADPTGANDSTAAFNAAIAAAGSGGTVLIPSGTFLIPGHITVNDVTVEGAGMWYSTITGAKPGFFGLGTPTSCGVPNNPAGVSSNVHLSNFAIFGQVTGRNDCDQDNGIGGAMSDSTVSDIWIEHMKVGAWMDGPMTNLTFSGMRIRDTFADGINLHGGVTQTTITNSEIRNTGDDGIATWADTSLGADAYDTISNNTVSQNQLANGIAIYGGNNNTVTGNLVSDTGITQGGGITAAQRFTSTPLGLTTISNNTMIRDGQLDPNWQFGVGALWFDGSQGAVTGPINVTNALIEQSPYEAIQWVEGTVSGVNLNNVGIIGTGTFAMQEQTAGAASFTNVTATGVAQANLGNVPSYNCEGTSFVITDGGGNSGISPQNCNIGDNPTPVYPPFPASTVQVNPTALNFSPLVTGSTSPAQTVSISNPVGTAASVSSITTSGAFSQTNNCGTSIAANGSCTASVTYTPTANGAQTGTLTVNAGGVTDTVTLSGTGVAPGPILSANPGALAFPSTIVGTADAAKTVSITNTGTTSATISNVSLTGAGFTQTNNCTTLAVNASCTATVGFTPAAAGANTGTLTVTSNANNSPLSIGLSGSGIGSTTNLAPAGSLTASSSASGFPATNANDGNTSTYWESLDGSAYPQTLSANLGQSYPLGSVTLTLPPSTAWSTRTETLSVLGSTNGTSWTTLVPSAGYTFNPASGNSVSFNLPSGTNDQYLELSFTGNTGWSAAQISEFEIFPATGGNTGTPSATLSASPSSLSFGSEAVRSSTAAQTTTITNTGTASASISSISASSGYGETSTCGAALAAGASCSVSVTFSPTASGSDAGSLMVSSNASNSVLSVALSGTGTGGSSTPTNLALNKSISSSSNTQSYVAANAVDGNTSTYWESVNGAWPTTLAVNLGATHSLSSVVVDLPPSSAWQTRTQTFSILGSTNGSTWTTLVGSASHTFNPATGNTVTINLPSGTSEQYLGLDFTANSVQNGAQVSELEVMGI